MVGGRRKKRVDRIVVFDVFYIRRLQRYIKH